MDEKGIVELAGEKAPEYCKLIYNLTKSFRGSYGLKGDQAYQKAIRSLMSRRTIPLTIGLPLLRDLQTDFRTHARETIRAINQLKKSENVKVWLNNAEKG